MKRLPIFREPFAWFSNLRPTGGQIAMEFFKIKRVFSRRTFAKYTVRSGAVAPRYSSKWTTKKGRVLGRKNLRPTGVEPIFPASEADALSIELRARKSILLFYKIKRFCALLFVREES